MDAVRAWFFGLVFGICQLQTLRIKSPANTIIAYCCFAPYPLLTDQSEQSKGLNYGFVEYDDPGAAERAMSTLNGRRVHQSVG